MQSTYNVSTDKQEKIKVESSICYALWLTGSARAGSKASLEVRTTFVGEGASIEITGYTSKDKKIGKISDTITRNRFVGLLDIPEKTDPGAMIYFEAKLPKHGLKMESNLIPVKPKVLVKKMGWDKKEVRRGDEVKIRFADGSEKEVQLDQNGYVKIEDVPPGPHSNPELIEDEK